MASKSCTLKFVNSLARRQHLFDVAATPNDVDSIFCRILHCPCANFVKCDIYHLLLAICSNSFMTIALPVALSCNIANKERRNIRHQKQYLTEGLDEARC